MSSSAGAIHLHRARRGVMLFGAAPLLLAGFLPLQPGLEERWSWSGSWAYPVGDPWDFSRPGPEDGVGYAVTRNVTSGHGARGHQGADLSNRQPGGRVRVAANGLVARVADGGWQSGYGRHVVIAHRLADGTLVYSVYAHLAPRSVTVRPGQQVAAGDLLGRVGMSGRATSPHLHFEIRLPRMLGERWEKAVSVDPMAFVALRLPGQRTDSTWARPLLRWAEEAALITRNEWGGAEIRRAAWWRMLAGSVPHQDRALERSTGELRRTLKDAGVVQAEAAADSGALVDWMELATDLEHARRLGLRLLPAPIGRSERAALCEEQFGAGHPAHNLDALSLRREGRPTVGEACLLLADVVGDRVVAPTSAKPQLPAD